MVKLLLPQVSIQGLCTCFLHRIFCLAQSSGFGSETANTMKEKGVLQAIIQGNCPRCRSGKMFKYSVFNIPKLNKIHAQCTECDLQYEREPGFFYGAMYVSYAFSVGVLLITTLVIYQLFPKAELATYIISVSVISFLTYPVNFRYSRILFLHLFGGVSYRPDIKKK